MLSSSTVELANEIFCKVLAASSKKVGNYFVGIGKKKPGMEKYPLEENKIGGDDALNDGRNVTISSMEKGADKKKNKKKKRKHSGDDAEFNVDELPMDDSKLSDGDKKKKRRKVMDSDVILGADTLSKSTEEGLNFGDEKKKKIDEVRDNDVGNTNNGDLNYGDEKKKEKKKKKKKIDEVRDNNDLVDVDNTNNGDKKKKKKKSQDVSDDTEFSNGGLNSGDKKKKKKIDKVCDNDVVDVGITDNGDKKKKSQDASDDTELSNRKKKKNNSHDAIDNSIEGGASHDDVVKESREDDVTNKEGEGDRRKKKKKKNVDVNKDEESQKVKKKGGGEENKVDESLEEIQGEKERNVETSDGEDKDLKKKKKKKKKGKKKKKNVSFLDEVEVFDSSLDPKDARYISKEDGLIYGKRFTPDEDEKIKEAVNKYIEAQQLGDDGVKMILHCKRHPDIRQCWKKIGTVLPYRPYTSIYTRAKIILTRFTPEEDEMIKEAVNKYIEVHELGDEGLKMVLNCKRHPELKNCWKEIGVVLPSRPFSAIYKRADILLAPEEDETDKENEDAKYVSRKDGLVHGKRFTPEEDEMIKEAVNEYIETHQLGDEGLEKLLNCKHHPELRHCWKEIGTVFPSRPYTAVYKRAHIVLKRNLDLEWTPENIKLIHDHYEKNGADWSTIAGVLGTHRIHVKDTWRRTRFLNQKKGHWSQDEYQKLFDLVNVDLSMKATEQRLSKYGMLRDNIAWTTISERLDTRSHATCCDKWYNQLQSPMVADGIWADVDDYRLVIELHELDAFCIEDVDWDSLLSDRVGDVCRQRWSQMTKQLGDRIEKSFSEQVETLYNRYCPDVLEAREAYDSRPPSDV